jgi:hypothetical protein
MMDSLKHAFFCVSGAFWGCLGNTRRGLGASQHFIARVKNCFSTLRSSGKKMILSRALGVGCPSSRSLSSDNAGAEAATGGTEATVLWLLPVVATAPPGSVALVASNSGGAEWECRGSASLSALPPLYSLPHPHPTPLSTATASSPRSRAFPRRAAFSFFLCSKVEEVVSTTRDQSGSTAEHHDGPCSSSLSLLEVMSCSSFFFLPWVEEAAAMC